MKRVFVVVVLVLLLGVALRVRAEQGDSALIVTSSNGAANELLVYDTAGSLVQTLSTQGQGGVGGNAGGIATQKGTVAVVNFGSQSVSIFERERAGFVLRQVVPTLSAPVSVAFGQNHLYVLGTATVESHLIQASGIELGADGVAPLLRADGSAAQLGVLGDQLVLSEKSGPVEVVALRGGAVDGTVTEVPLPAGSIEPFGLVTRGSNAYVTFATSDEVGLIRNGRVAAITAIGSGTPDGPGQHAPCWIALVGAYAFTSNSPSHSISRLVVTGGQVILEDPTAAHTDGAPIDIASNVNRIAVVVRGSNGQSQLVQFLVGDDGSLALAATTTTAPVANGVAIVAAP